MRIKLLSPAAYKWESISHIKMELGLSSTSLNMQKMIVDVDSFFSTKTTAVGVLLLGSIKKKILK